MNEQQSKWDESFKAGRDYNPLNQVFLDLVLNNINNDKKTAIDLGCGTGDAMVKLAKKGMVVTGADWSADALEKAQARADEAEVRDQVTFMQVDLDDLKNTSLKQHSTDVILCKLVIAFIKKQREFLETCKTLLSNNGVLVIQTPVLHDKFEYTAEDKPGIAVKFNEFKTLLGEVFESVKELDHSYYGDKGDLVTFIVR